MSYHIREPEKRIIYGATEKLSFGSLANCKNADKNNSFMYTYDCYTNIYYLFCVDPKNWKLLFTYRYDYMNSNFIDISINIWADVLSRLYPHDRDTEEKLSIQGITKQTFEKNIVKVVGI